MFIKITKSRNKEYVQIVEAYREKGKVKHRTLLSLGRRDQLEDNHSIQRLAERLGVISKLNKQWMIKTNQCLRGLWMQTRSVYMSEEVIM